MTTALELIGQTPMVELDRVHKGPGQLLAKCEFLNPGGSMKDRAAKEAILAALKRGDLGPGQPVVEMTSGNMGAGLAVVCAVLGHPLVVAISAGNSPARARMMSALGAEVILVPQVTGSPGQVTGADIEAAAVEAKKIASERDGFYVDQFSNLDCLVAHQTTTAPELWEQAEHRLDGLVTVVGTGATLLGCARFLRSQDSTIRCAAVEPAGAAILATGEVEDPQHSLQGSGYGVVPPHWEPSLVDLFLTVNDDEAREWQARIAAEEGLYVGPSSAANVMAASALLRSGELGREARVGTILCDTGLKYHA